jgi:DNA ligase-1
MQDLRHFKVFVEEINSENGRLYKQSILKKYKDDELVKRFLIAAFDPFLVFGLSTKKLGKLLPLITEKPLGVLELLKYLEINNTGRDIDIQVVHNTNNSIAITHEPDAFELIQLLSAIISKKLSIGCDVKTINKEIPGLIRTFDVQLANKYFDKPEYVEGKEFAITTKIDGGRIIAIKENGQVSFFTRAGQKYEGLVDLESEMLRFMPNNTCLDGEITLLDRGSLSSKEAYKETMKIVRTKDKEKHGIKMIVFDGMSVQAFKEQKCEIPYSLRRKYLQQMFDIIECEYFEMLPLLYVGSDTNKITELLEEQTSQGEEGIMINIWDAYYEFKRTNNLLKVKKFNTCDLRVIGFEEGTGKYVDMLGAFICEYKGGQVKVGSGLTDEQRVEVWRNFRDYENLIIEVSYFEETKDSTGKPSLRFPTFKDFRFDKTEPNY